MTSRRLGVRAALVEGRIVPGDVAVADGRITAVGLPGGRGDHLAVPGFVDLQVNGFAGVDLLTAEADGYGQVGQALVTTGVTAYLPTFITSRESDLVGALRRVGEAPWVPHVLGVHLEGPFLSPARMGTHPAELRRDPDPALIDRLLAAGPVRVVTLAADVPLAETAVRQLAAAGVIVSIGHSDADSAQAHAAFDAGARTVTHLGNAMPPVCKREPGLVGAALVRDDVVLQLIVDGHHLAEDFVRLACRAAPGRVALVTDAVAAAGMGDGTFRLGSVTVHAAAGAVRRADGTLAGSTLTMDAAVRNLHALGVSLEAAIGAATAVPAGLIGESERGRLRPHGPADVVVLDGALTVHRVLVDGQEHHAR